jgi:predicted nicotinamide N-methyase
MRSAADRAAFIRANTRLRPVPLAPEILLHLADEAVPLWQKTEEELAAISLPPPYWAFAWAGGQALARYVLDCADSVAGKRVLDLGAGSGLLAIAAAKAGAAPVVAADIEAFSEAAIMLNAEANGVHVETLIVDLLDGHVLQPLRHDVVLAGDLFYERDLAQRTRGFLSRCVAAGACVLVGDPGRAYLPREELVALATYSVPVTRDLEDNEIKRTTVFAFAPTRG